MTAPTTWTSGSATPGAARLLSGLCRARMDARACVGPGHCSGGRTIVGGGLNHGVSALVESVHAALLDKPRDGCRGDARRDSGCIGDRGAARIGAEAIAARRAVSPASSPLPGMDTGSQRIAAAFHECSSGTGSDRAARRPPSSVSLVQELQKNRSTSWI